MLGPRPDFSGRGFLGCERVRQCRTGVAGGLGLMLQVMDGGLEFTRPRLGFLPGALVLFLFCCKSLLQARDFRRPCLCFGSGRRHLLLNLLLALVAEVLMLCFKCGKMRFCRQRARLESLDFLA